MSQDMRYASGSWVMLFIPVCHYVDAVLRPFGLETVFGSCLTSLVTATVNFECEMGAVANK